MTRRSEMRRYSDGHVMKRMWKDSCIESEE